MRIFGRLKLVGIITLAFVLAGAVAECAFRLAGVETGGSVEMFEVFGDRSYRFRPGLATYLTWYPHGFNIHTTDAGLRTARGDPGWSHGPVDIVILGDSQAVGWGHEYKDTFPGIFASRCREKGLTVANLSLPQHLISNQLELLAWLREDRGLRARIVLLCVSPIFVTDPNGYRQQHVSIGGISNEPPSRTQLFKIWLHDNFATYLVLRQAWHNSKEREPQEIPEVYDKALEEERTPRLRAELEKVLEEADRCKARVVSVYMTATYRYLVDDLAKERGLNHDGAVPGRIARTAAEQLGIPFISFEPILKALVDEGVQVANGYGDVHYTIALNKACADHLWEAYDWEALASGN